MARAGSTSGFSAVLGDAREVPTEIALLTTYCWHQKHYIQKIIFWGINLCNVIDYTYIMKSSRELM